MTKTALITGGNSGIGKETARGLAARGFEVVLACRDLAKGRAAADEIRTTTGREVEVRALDLSEAASIRAFAARFLAERPRLDVLVLNAGLYRSDRRVTSDGFEEMFGVNHLGHFLLTRLLEERLVASAPARVVVVASDAHRRAPDGLDFDDLMSTRAFDGMRVYGRSKLANILFARELSRRLAPRGVTVNSLHPGVVATEFAGSDDAKDLVHWFFRLARPFLITAEQGAATSIRLASDPELASTTGLYFARERPAKPRRWAEDDVAARRLWEASAALLGLDPD